MSGVGDGLVPGPDVPRGHPVPVDDLAGHREVESHVGGRELVPGRARGRGEVGPGEPDHGHDDEQHHPARDQQPEQPPVVEEPVRAGRSRRRCHPAPQSVLCVASHLKSSVDVAPWNSFPAAASKVTVNVKLCSSSAAQVPRSTVSMSASGSL